MLFYCWATVADGGPAVKQYRVTVLSEAFGGRLVCHFFVWTMMIAWEIGPYRRTNISPWNTRIQIK